jgi:hypothetical protein
MPVFIERKCRLLCTQQMKLSDRIIAAQNQKRQEGTDTSNNLSLLSQHKRMNGMKKIVMMHRCMAKNGPSLACGFSRWPAKKSQRSSMMNATLLLSSGLLMERRSPI